MKKISTKQLATALYESITEHTEEEVSHILKEFVALVAKKKMLSKSDSIIEHYTQLSNREHGIIEATITVRERLPEKERTELTHTLKEKYKAKNVEIIENVDHRIIGGIKIKVGDTLYNGTVQNKLSQLRAKLTETI